MTPVTEEGRKEVKPTEHERVLAWRLMILCNAGFPDVDAQRIAERLQGPDAIDLHRAVKLLENGCDVMIALDILL